MTPCRFFAATGVLLALAGCATGLQRNSDIAPVSDVDTATFPVDERVVPERYVSPAHPGVELDSLATWPAPDGRTWLIASAKTAHTLMVFDADTGEWLQTVGGTEDAARTFKRPNGLAVHGDHLFVAERDNHRVQMLALPDFAPLGTFGEDQLRSPYGLWINEVSPGGLDVYVTDSFMYGKRFEIVPPLEELDQRVRRFHVELEDEGFRASYLGSFGDTAEPGALRVVESVAGDPTFDRLMIADERFPGSTGRNASTLREYTLAGTFTGRSLPEDTFATEAEGVALWACGPDTGYWVAVDQRETRTAFHLFQRSDLTPAGSFRGETTAMSDGIAVHAASTAAFPHGALFAIHNDESVSAFDLADIARSLELAAECTGSR
ncbi:NHL repeat-containing protein [Novilysobacter avium]|uniref:Phytase n=1 Tax=Novilysobacter avium TaxID=2781023 RepID=A0A7S6UJN7_9GAMM|nr:phytase [Lysobacter avium]QOW21537.1 phytase [Lysobacter avium]